MGVNPRPPTDVAAVPISSGRTASRSWRFAAPFVVPAPAGVLTVTGFGPPRRSLLRSPRLVRTWVGSTVPTTGRVQPRDGWTPRKAESRRERKRTLTAVSSSRWAGTTTRKTEDQYNLAARALMAEQALCHALTTLGQRRPRFRCDKQDSYESHPQCARRLELCQSARCAHVPPDATPTTRAGSGTWVCLAVTAVPTTVLFGMYRPPGRQLIFSAR